MDNTYSSHYNSYAQQAQTQTDGAFGWDDEIREESSFSLLPEGDYCFTIKKFEKAHYNGGDKIPPCPKAIVTFTVTAPDGRSAEITENFMLHRRMEWKLSEFFASVGLKRKDEPVRMIWTPELIGRQGVCRVSVHSYMKDGSERKTNRIEKLYPSYNQPQLAPPAQPSQQIQPWQQGWK